MSLATHRPPFVSIALLACGLAFACGEDGSGELDGGAADEVGETQPGPETTAGTETAETSSGDSADTGAEGPAGLEFVPALAGLWTGPVTMTPLGAFPTMNMDLQFVDGQVLFSRADLDAANSLRFAFSVETIAGADTLIYRNGGYFLGILRDSRTVLVEHEGVAGEGPASYRFCALDGGCDYIDALWEFDDAEHLVLDVKVEGMQHVYWLAERVQTRPVPEGLPEGLESQGAGDAPFPEMPSLRATVTWMDPLAMPGDVWVLLSKQDCGINELCDFSRSLLTTVEAGAVSGELLIDQLHPGDYKITAFLDRDQNLAETLFPGTGDGVSLPNGPVTVAPSGETTTTVPILVEL